MPEDENGYALEFGFAAVYDLFTYHYLIILFVIIFFFSLIKLDGKNLNHYFLRKLVDVEI